MIISEKLLKLAEADYYSYADQDDVWMENKIELAVKALNNLDNSKPNMAFGNSDYYDENMKLIGKGERKRKYSFEKALFSCVSQGMTMTVNKKTRDMIAETSGDSARQIQRYIRLTELEPELLQMVDEGKIALRPAVELSYLNDIEQQDLIEAIDLADATPSHAQTIKMRRFSEEGKLSPEVIESIMTEEKPNQKEKFTFKAERLRQYIPKSVPYEKTEEYVCKALEHYQRYLERQKERDR